MKGDLILSRRQGIFKGFTQEESFLIWMEGEIEPEVYRTI